MTACERNCNPVKCSEPVCEPGVRDMYYSEQTAMSCPVREFNGDGINQPAYVVTTCRKETESGVQRCPSSCPAGEALDIFIAEK